MGILDRSVRRVRESRFFKDSFALSAANVAEQLIAIGRGFVIRRILPPEIMGFWNLMTVAQGFLNTFDLGILSGATRELPLLRARGDHRELGRTYSAALWFSLFQNGVIACISVIYVRVRQDAYSADALAATYAAIAVFFFSCVYAAYQTFLVTAQEFVRLSRLSLFCAVFDFAAFILAAWRWGVQGLMLSSICSMLLRGAVFFRAGTSVGVNVERRFSWATAKKLLSFGIWIRLVDYPNALYNLASLLWVTKTMGVEALALFAMARGFATQVAEMSSKVGVVYSMRYLEQVGRGSPKEEIGRQMRRYLLCQLVVIVPLLCWAAFTAIVFAVNTFIPRYSAANKCFLVLLTSGFFYVFNSGLTNPWMADKRFAARGLANVFGLFSMTGSMGAAWFLFGARSIEGVSYAALAGSYLYFAYMTVAVGRDFWGPWGSLKILAWPTAAAVWTFGTLYCGQSFASPGPQGLLGGIRIMLSTGAVTLIGILPLTWMGLRLTGILGGGGK